MLSKDKLKKWRDSAEYDVQRWQLVDPVDLDEQPELAAHLDTMQRLLVCIDLVLDMYADIEKHHTEHRVQNCAADREFWLKYELVGNNKSFLQNQKEELENPVI